MPCIHVKHGENVMAAVGRAKQERIAEIVSDAAINAARMVEDARLDERERCAKIAESYRPGDNIAKAIAALIRNEE